MVGYNGDISSISVLYIHLYVVFSISILNKCVHFRGFETRNKSLKYEALHKVGYICLIGGLGARRRAVEQEKALTQLSD